MSMINITILCSSKEHPVNSVLNNWIENHAHYQVELVRKKEDLLGGDILFLVSCSEIIAEAERRKYKKTLVLHASDLPDGRGWSPHVWGVVNGHDKLTLSLIEAEDDVDTGDIWKKKKFSVPKDYLYDEINDAIFCAEYELMEFAVDNFEDVHPMPQRERTQGDKYYRKRVPEDSKLDPSKSISEQFDLIRVCDPDRYPAFFEMHGCTYKIRLEKA